MKRDREEDPLVGRGIALLRECGERGQKRQYETRNSILQCLASILWRAASSREGVTPMIILRTTEVEKSISRKIILAFAAVFIAMMARRN